ncbi:hypothetical protein BJY01DRAFT_248895 [Aspergillus pseudoustus]|uniref:Uncharacterized protein n=1 Tax=Aspergillus pseudoustus TaxID=1810923 RepID=A0ABR4JUH2_9EURO
MHVCNMIHLLLAIWLAIMAVGVQGWNHDHHLGERALETASHGPFDKRNTTAPGNNTSANGTGTANAITSSGVVQDWRNWVEPYIPYPEVHYDPASSGTPTKMARGDTSNDRDYPHGTLLPYIPVHPGYGHPQPVHPPPYQPFPPGSAGHPRPPVKRQDLSSDPPCQDLWNDPCDDNGLPIPFIPFPGGGHPHHPPTRRQDFWNDPHDENGLPIPFIPFPGGQHPHHPPTKDGEGWIDLEGEDTNTIDKRNYPNLFCYHGNLAPAGPIRTAMKTLRRKNGSPFSGAKACHRVWCEQDTCVSWCNDNPAPRGVRSFSNIADGLQTILSNCPLVDGKVSGQFYHPEHWRVIVHEHSCEA